MDDDEDENDASDDDDDHDKDDEDDDDKNKEEKYVTYLRANCKRGLLGSWWPWLWMWGVKCVNRRWSARARGHERRAGALWEKTRSF